LKHIIFISFLFSFVMGQQKVSHEAKLWKSVFIFQSHQKMAPSMYIDDVDGFLMNKADNECSDIMDIIEHKPVDKTSLNATTNELESTIEAINNGPHTFPIKEQESSKYKINYFSSSS